MKPTATTKMFVSENADQTTYTHNGATYHIYDAYPTAEGVQDAARDVMTEAGRVHMNTRTDAITVDLGDDAGRLRYALFISPGTKINKGV